MKAAQKLKVAFFAEILIRDFDGASRTMYQIIDRIPRDRFDYLFICGTPPEHEIEFEVFKTPAITIPFNKTYKAAFPYLSKNKLIDKLETFKPDVIHIASPSPLGSFAVDYGKRKGVPILTIYHTHFVSYMEYYFKRAPFMIGIAEGIVKSGYRKFYNRCDMVYVPTLQMISELENYGIKPDLLKQWQRGLNHEVFRPEKKDLDYVKGITGNDKPNIIYASRLVWEKNVATLLKIYDVLEEQEVDVNFIVAGDGVAEKAAQEHMKKAYFLGHVNHEELSKLYASSVAFIFPSISETYGNVVVEAMASGCIPVIARGGGSQSLVSDGITGYLCRPNDPKDYVKHIISLLSDDQLRSDMIKEGLAYTSRLDWDTLTDEYFSDVEKLASK